MATRHMKRCSMPLTIRDTQVKTTGDTSSHLSDGTITGTRVLTWSPDCSWKVMTSCHSLLFHWWATRLQVPFSFLSRYFYFLNFSCENFIIIGSCTCSHQIGSKNIIKFYMKYKEENFIFAKGDPRTLSGLRVSFREINLSMSFTM